MSPSSPSRPGIAKRSIEQLGDDVKIAHRDAKKRKMSREDHDAVVCLFLELFDFHKRACQVGLMHWYEGHHADLKTSIRAKWGGEDDQSPDESFNFMFRRGREILEARFPDEVARLRDAGLSIEDVEYDDLDLVPHGRRR